MGNLSSKQGQEEVDSKAIDSKAIDSKEIRLGWYWKGTRWWLKDSKRFYAAIEKLKGRARAKDLFRVTTEDDEKFESESLQECMKEAERMCGV